MYGVVTRNAEEVRWPEFERGFYEVKDVTGRQEAALEYGVNMVSCFGDNNAADDEELVPVDEEGRRATRERKYFDWAYVCPTHEGYREGLLELIDGCLAANDDLRLDDVGFPRPEYCHCDRCERRFAAWSEEQGRNPDEQAWFDWRAEVITGFVAEVAERVPGALYLTVFPDPYPGHLYKRSGLDLDALSEHVDEFVVPLYDMAYSTTYWLKTIASGFETRLEVPFSIELYAVDVDLDNLAKAAEVADHYAESVLFGYDGGQARGVVRRLRAAANDEGDTYRPEDLDDPAEVETGAGCDDDH